LVKPGNIRHTGDCRPVGEILARIGDKWSVLVVTRLGGGTMRFSELRRELHGISQKMLTTTLRGLERDGFVTRTVTPSIPPRVDYELTDLGRDLLVPVRALGQWAVRNKERVEAARQAYDGSSRSVVVPAHMNAG
jgi:DNA-binding HxlR family transcriptional regulator